MLVHTASTMGQRGLLNPGRPDRVVRQLWALKTWGYGLGGELRSAAVSQPGPAGGGRRAPHAHLPTTPGRGLHPCRPAASERSDQPDRPAPPQQRRLRHRRDRLRRRRARRGPDEHPARRRTARVDPGRAADRSRGCATTSSPRWSARPSRCRPCNPVPIAATQPRRPRSIVLTSGTTGWPKGARRPTSAGMAPLISILSRIPIQVCDRILIAAPMFHTWGFAGLQISLAMRATIVLRSRFDAADALDTLQRENCDALFAVPVMLHGCSTSQRARPRPARRRRSADRRCPATLATRFMDAYGDILYNLYGSTEASWVSIATPADLRQDPTTAGRPPKGTDVRIVDGAIHVAQRHAVRGLHQRLPAARLVDGLLSTGDRGHWSDGRPAVRRRPGRRHDHLRRRERLPVHHRARHSHAARRRRRRRLRSAGPGVRRACGGLGGAQPGAR